MFSFDLEALQTENFNKANTAIEEMYAYIREKISIARAKSITSKKPLLVLIGERHSSFFSSLSGIVAITAAIESGIRSFLREEDDTRNQNVNECVQYYSSGGTELKPWAPSCTAVYTRRFLYALSLKFQMADKGADGHQLLPYKEKNIPEQANPNNQAGIKYRNEVMSDVFKQNGSQDIFAMVGSVHLKGLATEEHLEDFYEIVLLNSAENDEDYSQEGSYYWECEEFNRKLDNLMNLFYKTKDWTICGLPHYANNYFFDLFESKSKNALGPINNASLLKNQLSF